MIDWNLFVFCLVVWFVPLLSYAAFTYWRDRRARRAQLWPQLRGELMLSHDDWMAGKRLIAAYSHRCTHPLALRDPVSGTPTDYCESARIDSDKCGLSGRWWEPKCEGQT